MKFSKILIWVLISVSSMVSAQDTPIRWSPDFEEESGDKMGNILYDDGANVYLFVYNRSKGKKTMIPGIMKLDNSMKPVLRQDFTAAAGENEDMFLLNDIKSLCINFIIIMHKYMP